GWGTIQRWARGDFESEFRELGGHTEAIVDVAFSPDGQAPCSAARDGTARIWDVQTGQSRSFKGRAENFVSCVAPMPARRRLVTGGSDSRLHLWDIKTGSELRVFTGHAGPVTSIAVTTDGRRVLSGSLDHTARLWDVENGKEIRRLSGHGGGVCKVAISPDGRRALTSTSSTAVAGGRTEFQKVFDNRGALSR